MLIKQFEDNMVDEVVKLWNNTVANQSIYKPFTKESFINKFNNNYHFDYEGTLVVIVNDEIIGFGNAVVMDKTINTPGYVTCVVVKEEHQRQGIGSLVLKELESYIKKQGKNHVRQIFFNPISLEWIIPGSNNHDHPNAPGVPFNTPWYFLLMANGYVINGQQQDAYYRNIVDYELPEKIKQSKRRNTEEGLNITFYDGEKHKGFDELFKDLNNDLWKKSVDVNLAKINPNPMLIVEKDGEILGWTGPLHTEKSGRGYFAGIGISPKVQGRGLGKALFCELVLQSSNNGATFLSLFTGSENLARNIYLSAGFKIVQSFAILKKELI